MNARGIALCATLIFGLSVAATGAASIVLHKQLTSAWRLGGSDVFNLLTGAVELVAGVLFLVPSARRPAAAAIALVYAVFTLTFVPDVVAQPWLYYHWGALFYQTAIVAGALTAAGALRDRYRMASLAAVLMGLSSISFGIEQFEFLTRTNSLVPQWVPLSPEFWSVVTGFAFFLAGLALVLRRAVRVSAVLLGLMLVLFGCMIWVPAVLSNPAVTSNWSEGLATFAIGGAALLVGISFDAGADAPAFV